VRVQVSVSSNGADAAQNPPPLLAVTRYDVTAEPPSSAGADHTTTASPSPGDADTSVGAPGTVRGVTTTASDARDVPTALVAVTVKEYSVPFVNPMTSHDNPAVTHDAPPGDAVTS
jgi:hypothetical protein